MLDIKNICRKNIGNLQENKNAKQQGTHDQRDKILGRKTLKYLHDCMDSAKIYVLMVTM